MAVCEHMWKCVWLSKLIFFHSARLACWGGLLDATFMVNLITHSGALLMVIAYACPLSTIFGTSFTISWSVPQLLPLFIVKASQSDKYLRVKILWLPALT